MRIHSPYSLRSRVSKTVFWAVLILLVNGWVDYANHSLRNPSWTKSYDSVLQDDYDTFYEWIAEELLDIENSIPEQDGDKDDTGKIVDLKIYTDVKQLVINLMLFNEGENVDFFYILQQWDNPPIGIWDPPPNV